MGFINDATIANDLRFKGELTNGDEFIVIAIMEEVPNQN